MQSLMIVSCGEALVDLVPHAVVGGGPMNVAVAAARLRAPAAFVGCVSTDPHGEMIWDHLIANGVDVSASTRDPAPTARAIVEHVPELVFRFEGEGTADTLLSDADLASLGAGPHIVHGGTLGLFRGRTAETLARLVEAHDGLVSLDPNVRPKITHDRMQWQHYHDRWLARTDIYKASDEDLEWIWPNRTPDSGPAELLAGGVGVVVVTKGADGLTIVTPAGEWHVAAPPVDVVDTVGAGDSLIATVLVGLWEHGVVDGSTKLSDLGSAEWTAIGERATEVASITCSRAGADPPRRDELDW